MHLHISPALSLSLPLRHQHPPLPPPNSPAAEPARYDATKLDGAVDVIMMMMMMMLIIHTIHDVTNGMSP